LLSPRRAVALIALGAVCGTVPVYGAERVKAGRALVTFYWLIDESSSRYSKGKENAVLRDVHGNVIAKTRRQFKLDLVREGSGWLRDGRTVMFQKKVGGESRSGPFCCAACCAPAPPGTSAVTGVGLRI